MKIAALSDIHLGFRGLRARVRGRHAREADVEKAWLEAVRGICMAQPDLITIAGDIFESPVVSNHAINAWLMGIRYLLSGTTAELVVVQGNHDAAKTSNTLTPLELTHAGLVDDADVRRVHLCLEGRTFSALGGEALVTAMPYMTGGKFRFNLPEPDRCKLNICVIHSRIDAPALPRFYADGGVSIDILSKHFDVVHAGDYHQFVMLDESEDCMAFYSGSLERATTHPWQEQGPFGWVLYDAMAETATHMPVSTRPMLDEHLALTEGDDGPGTVNETLDMLLDREDTKDAMVRLVATGFDRTEKRAVNWTTVRRLKHRALHFQLDLRHKNQLNITLADRRADRKTLQEQAEEFFGEDPANVRQRCLGYIDPSWRPLIPREEVMNGE